MSLRTIAAGLAICGSASAQVVVPVLQKPVSIIATYDPSKIMENGECRSSFPVYRIESRGRTLSVEPGFVRSCRESNEVAVRKAVNVYGPFITIRGDCGGNAWSCSERALLTFTGDEVTRLGRIDDYLFALGGTLFLKHFDWNEANDYTGHSHRPIRIVLNVVDRRLVLDPELTWIFNHDRIEEGKWQPGRDGCGRDPEASRQTECYDQLIYTLQMAKLTGRTSLYKEAIAQAQRTLDAATLRDIRKLVEVITPDSVQKWLDSDRE